MDLFSKCQKETMHNLDQANQEIERLRKYINKQQAELQGLFSTLLEVSCLRYYNKLVNFK